MQSSIKAALLAATASAVALETQTEFGYYPGSTGPAHGYDVRDYWTASQLADLGRQW